MQQLVQCHTLFNETKFVPAASLMQRPSVYGIVLHEQKVLVAKSRLTQKFMLPGGGIEKGEAIDAALKREMWEETCVQVEVDAFLDFTTDFFYYDPMDLAIHGFLFYYHCVPLTLELNPPEYPPEEDLELPLWSEVADLSA